MIIPGNARLVGLSGAGAGVRARITGPVFMIGRLQGSDLTVADPRVSKRHAVILERDGRLVIEDLGSANGTLVNNLPVDSVPLKAGDTIQVGTAHFVVEVGALMGSDSQTVVGEAGSDTDLGVLAVDSFDPRVSGVEMRARNRLQQDYERLRIAFDALSSLLRSKNLPQLYEGIIDVVFELVNVEAAAVVLFDDSGEPRIEARRSNLPDSEELLVLSRTVLQYVLSTRSAVLAGDLLDDTRFSASTSISGLRARSLMCVPLIGRDDVHGVVLAVNSSEFTSLGSEDLALFHGIGVGAGVALDNMQLNRRNIERERLAAVGVAVSSVAHYLRNIIAAVSTPLAIIRKGRQSRQLELIDQALPLAERAAGRMEHAVGEMLDYSKSRAPEFTIGDLNELVRDAVDIVRPLADERGIELRVELDPGIDLTLLDHNRLHDAVLNLIRNAVEAHSKGGRDPLVHVRTVKSSDHTEQIVEVRDNGVGIPLHLLDKIFLPFFSTKGSQGTGLGLANARKVTQENGGSLVAFSRLGEGTMMRMSLPIESADDMTITWKLPDELKDL